MLRRLLAFFVGGGNGFRRELSKKSRWSASQAANSPLTPDPGKDPCGRNARPGEQDCTAVHELPETSGHRCGDSADFRERAQTATHRKGAPQEHPVRPKRPNPIMESQARKVSDSQSWRFRQGARGEGSAAYTKYVSIPETEAQRRMKRQIEESGAIWIRRRYKTQMCMP